MLVPSSQMWNGHFESISVVKRIVNLTVDANAVHSASYQAKSKVRNFQLINITQLHGPKVFETGTPEWDAPILFTSKRDATLHFCIVCKIARVNCEIRIYPTAERRVYQFHSKVHWFSKLDTIRRCWQVEIDDVKTNLPPHPFTA